ncbi:hypothetical protein Tco_0393721 [Tanacetum coccineum]
MFQQHQGESLFKAWTHFKDLLQNVHPHGINLWLHVQIFYDHVNPATRRTIDKSVGDKLHDKNAEESWALIEDLTLYDNESWNDLRDFANPVKAISLPHDVPNASDRRLIELENQVQRLIGTQDTQYCIENPKKAFVDYAFSRIDEAGGTDNAKIARKRSNSDTGKEREYKSLENAIKVLIPLLMDYGLLDDKLTMEELMGPLPAYPLISWSL